MFVRAGVGNYQGMGFEDTVFGLRDYSFLFIVLGRVWVKSVVRMLWGW